VPTLAGSRENAQLEALPPGVEPPEPAAVEVLALAPPTPALAVAPLAPPVVAPPEPVVAPPVVVPPVVAPPVPPPPVPVLELLVPIPGVQTPAMQTLPAPHDVPVSGVQVPDGCRDAARRSAVAPGRGMTTWVPTGAAEQPAANGGDADTEHAPPRRDLRPQRLLPWPIGSRMASSRRWSTSSPTKSR